MEFREINGLNGVTMLPLQADMVDPGVNWTRPRSNSVRSILDFACSERDWYQYHEG